MPSAVSCPKCHGSKVRQITHGYYECLERIVVGAVPPEATGHPHPTPVERPCGNRFQIGPPVATPSCAFCGLDSIGTCEGGCNRRLCGTHGTIRPPFLCRECLGRRKAEEAEEEAAARKRVEEEWDRNQAELDSALEASDDPHEVARVLRKHEELVDVDRCRAAWSRLVASLSLEPIHECVEIVGRGIRFFDLRVGASEPGRWREVDGSRIGVWRAAGGASQRHRSYGDIEESVESGFDLFLTAEGDYWRSTGSQEVLWLQAGGRGRKRLVLPKGRSFETVRERGHLVVPDSIQVSKPDAPSTHIDRSVENPMDFVRAVAAILEGLEDPAFEGS
jgi:hypothetical protein